METDAISIANYFIDKSKTDNCEGGLTLLRLVKYVYISYGFALAILGKSIINERFDKVEAWRYGPVIPSVYHSFKHNENKVIKEKSQVLCHESTSGELHFTTPKLEDNDIKAILDMVWKRYKDVTAGDLIDLLHKDGTPWKFCYKPGMNKDIPEGITKLYYKGLVKHLLSN